MSSAFRRPIDKYGMPIYHVKTSTLADGTDGNLIRPSDWNSDHAYTMQEAVSILGNTAGTLASINSGTLFLAGGDNITLSQSGNTVSIVGAANTGGTSGGNNNAASWSMFPYPLPASTAGSTYYSGSTSQGAGGASTQTGYTFSIYFVPIQLPVPVVFSEMRMPISYNTAAGTGSATVLWSLGIYSNNNSTLSKVEEGYGGIFVSQNSVTANTFSVFTYSTAGNTSNSANPFAGLSTSSINSSQGNVSAFLQGAKNIEVHVGTTTLTAGNYWLALANCIRTSGAAIATVSWGQSNAWSSAVPGEFGAHTSNAVTGWIAQPFGAISTTFTSVNSGANFFGLPNSVPFTNVTSSVTSAQRYHWAMLKNL
jgi:hypothetical protein